MNNSNESPRPAASGPGVGGKVATVVVVALLIGFVLYLKRERSVPGEVKPAKSSGIPRLVDLGAKKCIPCKMMAPILEELKKEYAGRLEVIFIDVWKNPAAGKKYGIRVIPTQIFYDAAGKELYRHEGYFSKAQILKTWARYGIKFEGKKPAEAKEPPAGKPANPILPKTGRQVTPIILPLGEPTQQ